MIRPGPSGAGAPATPAPPAAAQRPQAPNLQLGQPGEVAAQRQASSGGPMPRSEWPVCPTCHTRNEPGHRFCIACGSPVLGEAPSPAIPPSPGAFPLTAVKRLGEATMPLAPSAPSAQAPHAVPLKTVPIQPVQPAPAPPIAPVQDYPSSGSMPVELAAAVFQPTVQGPTSSGSMPIEPAAAPFSPIHQATPPPGSPPVAAPMAGAFSPQAMPRPAAQAAMPVPQPSPHPVASPVSYTSGQPVWPGAEPVDPSRDRVRPPTVPDGVAAAAVAVARRDSDADPRPPEIRPAKIICPRCQSPAEPSTQFCMVCGFALRDAGFSSGGMPVAPLAAPYVEVPASPAQELQRLRPPDSIRTLQPPASILDRTDQYGGPTAAARPSGRVVLLGKDGSDNAAFPLNGDMVDIGAHEGLVQIPDDPYLSSRHARIVREGDRWFVLDLGSVNGVYVRVRGARPLTDGDLILLGQQVLRFEVVMDAEQGLRPATQHGTALFGTPQTPRYARLCQRTVEGVTRDVFHLHRAETSLGRETADIVFSDDPFLSRRHAVIRVQTNPAGAAASAHNGAAAPYMLEDLSSSNGTFLAIRGREALASGDLVRVGLHVLRFELNDPGLAAPGSGAAGYSEGTGRS